MKRICMLILAFFCAMVMVVSVSQAETFEFVDSEGIGSDLAAAVISLSTGGYFLGHGSSSKSVNNFAKVYAMDDGFFGSEHTPEFSKRIVYPDGSLLPASYVFGATAIEYNDVAAAYCGLTPYRTGYVTFVDENWDACHYYPRGDVSGYYSVIPVYSHKEGHPDREFLGVIAVGFDDSGDDEDLLVTWFNPDFSVKKEWTLVRSGDNQEGKSVRQKFASDGAFESLIIGGYNDETFSAGWLLEFDPYVEDAEVAVINETVFPVSNSLNIDSGKVGPVTFVAAGKYGTTKISIVGVNDDFETFSLILPKAENVTLKASAVRVRDSSIFITGSAEDDTGAFYEYRTFMQRIDWNGLDWVVNDPVIIGNCNYTVGYDIEIFDDGSVVIPGMLRSDTDTGDVYAAYSDEWAEALPEEFVISASAGNNGLISPAGDITVTEGGSKTFTITPDADYYIADVLVDGTSVGAVSSYTFSNVSADHSIEAVFAEVIYYFNITASDGEHGSISPSGVMSIIEGGSQTFTITPNDGCYIADVLVNGASVGSVGTYTFSGVSADQAIEAEFAQYMHTITASADEGCVISPSGVVTVAEGEGQTFNIVLDDGFYVADVKVNGASVGAVETYTFSSVMEDQTIEVETARYQLVLLASAGEGGVISPDDESLVFWGDDISFSIYPNSDYMIEEVLIDGASVGAIGSYIFENVIEGHTIEAFFEYVEPPDEDPDYQVICNIDGLGCVDRDDLLIILEASRDEDGYYPEYDLNGKDGFNLGDVIFLIRNFTNENGASCQ